MSPLNNLQNNIFVQTFLEQIMKSTLKIKDFGPIKDVDIVLKNVNVFIGPQASGKSTLAKIFTIFKSPRKFLLETGIGLNETHKYSTEIVIEVLRLFNIEKFLTPTTEICFDSEVHKISLSKGEIIYDSKLLNKLKYIRDLMERGFEGNKNEIAISINSFFKPFALFHIRASQHLRTLKLISTSSGFAQLGDLLPLSKEKIGETLKFLEDIEVSLSTNAAVYIPAERIIANIIKEYLANLVLNKVPIPQHILAFAAELEKSKPKSIDLGFIQKGLKYKLENGNQNIYINDTQFISLESAASGIQSIIPILSFSDKMQSQDHSAIVIEEPELNLFPTAQYRLLELIESIRKDPTRFGWEDLGIIHTYTTHSPYVLSALNNFLYAHKIIKELCREYPYGSQMRIEKEKEITAKVKSIVRATIDPESFTAYQISDGFASPIFNESEGLISDNFIDESTDIINDDFDKLMEMLDNGIDK